MKKIISLLLIFIFLIVFSACGKNGALDDNALETAETYVQITGNAGSLSINENVARTLLEVYPKESLGLTKEIYDYDLKLSATRFLENDACLVEAFLGKADKPEGVFVILGQQCFVYDSKQNKYFLLTMEGAQEINVGKDSATTTAIVTEVPYEEAVEEKNNKKLHELFDGYSKEKLGLDKEISEYFLVATGTTTTAEDGNMVFVIRLKEQNGEFINHTVAFNDDGNYMFDYEINKYKKLS